MKITRRFIHAWAGAFAMLTMAGAAPTVAEPAQSREDRQRGVTVIATLVPPVTAEGPLRVKVVLDTHSVNLDGLVFERIVVARTPDGGDAAPVAIEDAKGSSHHREAIAVFEALRSPVTIVVKDVGGVPERQFSWELPATK